MSVTCCRRLFITARFLAKSQVTEVRCGEEDGHCCCGGCFDRCETNSTLLEFRPAISVPVRSAPIRVRGCCKDLSRDRKCSHLSIVGGYAESIHGDLVERRAVSERFPGRWTAFISSIPLDLGAFGVGRLTTRQSRFGRRPERAPSKLDRRSNRSS